MGIAEVWCHSDIRTPWLPWGYPAKGKKISDNPTNNPTKHVLHPDHHNQVRHRNRQLERSPLFDRLMQQLECNSRCLTLEYP